MRGEGWDDPELVADCEADGIGEIGLEATKADAAEEFELDRRGVNQLAGYLTAVLLPDTAVLNPDLLTGCIDNAVPQIIGISDPTDPAWTGWPGSDDRNEDRRSEPSPEPDAEWADDLGEPCCDEPAKAPHDWGVDPDGPCSCPYCAPEISTARRSVHIHLHFD